MAEVKQKNELLPRGITWLGQLGQEQTMPCPSRVGHDLHVNPMVCTLADGRI